MSKNSTNKFTGNPKLLLASCAYEDLGSLHEAFLISRNDRVWPKGLFGYVGLGTTDLVLVAKDEDANNLMYQFLQNKLGLNPGYVGASNSGWSRIYLCDLIKTIEDDNLKSCHPFGYLLLIRELNRKESHQEFKEKLINSFNNNLERTSIWETGGYYQWCVITGQYHDSIPSSCVLQLREKGLQTYMVPLVSLEWIYEEQNLNFLREFNDREVNIYLEANTFLGKELDAAKILCRVLKKCGLDEKKFNCSFSNFRITHGIKDLCLAGEAKVRLGEFVRETWNARKTKEVLKATRTYLVEDIPAIWKVDQGDLNCCTNSQPCLLAESSKKYLMTCDQPIDEILVKEQIQPIKPFNVIDLARGWDWTGRIEYIRTQIRTKVIESYKNVLKDLDKDQSKNTQQKYPIPDLNLNVCVRGGAQLPYIEPVVLHDDEVSNDPTEFNIVISHEDIKSDWWEDIGLHELTLAALRTLIAPIISHRLTGNESQSNLPNYPISIKSLANIIWKTIGESIGTAIILEKRKWTVEEYNNNILLRRKRSNSEHAKIQKEHVNRLVLGKFLKNRLSKSRKGDFPGLHWLGELKIALDEVNIDFHIKENINSFILTLLGPVNYSDFNAIGKENFSGAINFAWLMGLALSREIVGFFCKDTKEEFIDNVADDIIEPQQVSFNLFINNYPPNIFFRSLFIEDKDFSDLQKKTASNIIHQEKNNEQINENIELLKKYVEMFNQVETLINKDNSKFHFLINEPIKQDDGENIWTKVPFDSLREMAIIAHKIRTKLLQKNKSEKIHSLIPDSKFSPFFSINCKNISQQGGELLANFKLGTLENDNGFELTINNGQMNNLNFPNLLRLFVQKDFNEPPFKYSPLHLFRRFELENLCIDGAIKHIGSNEKVNGKYISFNITPWLFDPLYNPWYKTFINTYLTKVIILCEKIIEKGSIPVIEITEGEILQDYEKPFWEFLVNLKKHIKFKNKAINRIGLAIDDQYSPGTDFKRLKQIKENIIKEVKEKQFNPFIIKIDHQVLFSFLRISENLNLNEVSDNDTDIPLQELYKKTFSLLGDLTYHTIEEMVDSLIIFEGYSGYFEWDNETKNQFQSRVNYALQNAFKNNIRNILLQSEK